MNSTTLKERPILFSTPMVNAILSGQKTQTRRQVKQIDRLAVDVQNTDLRKLGDISGFSPFGQVGDVLWVRETWQQECAPISDGFGVGLEATGKFVYKADGTELPKRSSTLVYSQWKPSIHMPREACRLRLEITNIRVERLYDISEADAKAEGITWNKGPVQSGYGVGTETKHIKAITCFSELWINTYGVVNWNANPWVWVIEFKKI